MDCLYQYLSCFSNTGRNFDLETNLRIAEFKFIHWKGGAEAIRQNGIFKDFYALAEAKTSKRKELYVLGATQPLRFFQGQRAIKSVLSKNVRLLATFQDQYPHFTTVSQYYQYRQHDVKICDASPFLPELAETIG